MVQGVRPAHSTRAPQALRAPSSRHGHPPRGRLGAGRPVAQEPMKFASLVLLSPINRSQHDLFASDGRGQAALRHQPA
jgi:hypothetical protein